MKQLLCALAALSLCSAPLCAVGPDGRPLSELALGRGGLRYGTTDPERGAAPEAPRVSMCVKLVAVGVCGAVIAAGLLGAVASVLIAEDKPHDSSLAGV